MKKISILLLVLTTLAAHALDNGRSFLPKMGWDPWYQYDGTNANNAPNTGWNSTIISNTVQALCNLGFTNAGYNYINFDAGWQSNRDSLGEPVPAPNVFPGGIAAMVNYIHAMGLKTQLYYSCGSNTDFVYTNHWTGSLNYFTNDCAYAATNGFDWVYLDISFANQTGFAASTIISYMYSAWLYTNNSTMGLSMGDGLTPTSGGAPWFAFVNDWRGMQDNQIPGTPINFGIITNRFYTNLLTAFNYSQQGFQNNFDMIVIGMTNNPYYGPVVLTTAEKRSYFGLWCMSASPLILSCSVSNLNAQDSAILTNRDVIAVDQDPLVMSCTNAGSYFVKPLAGGIYAVAFLNIGTTTNRASINFASLGLPNSTMVHDCWGKQDLGIFNGGFAAYVAPHDCLIYTLRNPLVTESFQRTYAASYPVLANNLVGWYDASVIQAQNGSVITNWVDQSPGGTNSLQVNTIDSANPVLNAAAQNGLNVLNFSGLADNGTGLLATNGSSFNGLNDCFIVFQTTNAANSQSLIGWNGASANTTALGIFGPQKQMWDRNLFFGQTLMDTKWHVFRWSINTNTPDNNQVGQARNHWIDGRLDQGAGVNPNASSVTNLYIGTDFSNHSSNPMGGSIAEIRIYNTYLTPAQAKQETANLGRKWGITVVQ